MRQGACRDFFAYFLMGGKNEKLPHLTMKQFCITFSIELEVKRLLLNYL